MTRLRNFDAPRIRVVHAVPGRMRLKSALFADPSLDPHYVGALVSAVSGVQSVRINRQARSLVVKHRTDVQVHDDVLARLRALPMDAFLPDIHDDLGPDPLEVGMRVFAAALIPLLPMSLKAGLSWALSAPTLARGVDTLFSEGLKVDVLDAGVRVFSLMRREYFIANTVGALLSFAAYMEHASAGRANDLLKTLLQPTVDSVRVERDGSEALIPYEQAVEGDVVICGPGEMISVDGVVVDGEAAVNASSITGEPVPLHVRVGDRVMSGGLIEDGKLKIEAAAVGADTSMARISRILEKSLRNKSKSQRRSEALADRLVPLTFVAGLGMYALTGSAARAASVLTVDYSCAIKLAAPVAVRTAMHAAGRGGVLLKGAQTLEALAGVDTMVFDKTGTLTRGILEVTDILPLDGWQEDALLALAAGAEEHYGHPAARAVLQSAHERNLVLPKISQVDFIVAHGVSAHVEGRRVLVGSRHFVHEDEGVDCNGVEAEVQALRDQGKTVLYVAREGRLVGLIALRDVLRDEAAATLEALRSQGVTRLIMLTGDHPQSACAIAELLPGLDEVHAGLRPEEKALKIQALKDQGRRLAFVGDGVNDSPALLSADVGICMPMAADLARDAAQVVLLRDDLHGLVLSLGIARRTEEVLRRCLWSAVGINSVLMGLAGAGVIPTLASAALHNASTIGILAYAAMNKGGTDALHRGQGAP
jgi:heavy metal translocating P-type ATPase